MYPNPDFGDDYSEYLADPLVAMLPGVRGRVAQAAAEGAAIATSVLNGHRTHGHGNSKIEIQFAGGPDILVTLVDPKGEADGGGGHAMAIEGETQALATAFGTPTVDKPDVRRSTKDGRYLKRRVRDGQGRFMRGGG